MRLSHIAALTTVLAIAGWVVYNRPDLSAPCTVMLDPAPGTLAEFAGAENSGNIDLPDGLGHFRAQRNHRDGKGNGAIRGRA